MQPEEFVPWMGSRTEMGPLKASEVTVPTCVGRRVGVPQGRALHGCLELKVVGYNISVVMTKAREDEKVWPSSQDHTDHRK